MYVQRHKRKRLHDVRGDGRESIRAQVPVDNCSWLECPTPPRGYLWHVMLGLQRSEKVHAPWVERDLRVQREKYQEREREIIKDRIEEQELETRVTRRRAFPCV